jgi:aspartyl-tRNA(Asn)/glutamyl-tRNA(Gln) amidotransferase subunit C
MSLSLEAVRHVASLARLALTPDEELAYQRQLSAILEAFDALKSLDTSRVAPTQSQVEAGAGALLGTREDVRQPSLPPDEAMRNAPDRSGTSFRVPRVLE